MKTEFYFDVAVIGGGPAGLAAAIAARREGAERVAIFERDFRLGGILNQCIHNGFGLHLFGEELTGPEYANRFERKLEGVQVFLDTMVLDITGEKRIVAVQKGKGIIECTAGSIVLAMGCRERARGALNIGGTRPAGVMTAGMAQRLINIDGKMCAREVVILGSGDIGLIMARRMTWEGAKVRLVAELMPFSSGLTRNIVQCLDDYGIPLMYNTTVIEVHGRERVTGVTIASVDQRREPIPGTEKYIECDTLLLSVGLLPENELTAPLNIEMDAVTSGAVVDQFRQTSRAGIFACGNVLHVHDLADNVSSEADIAGAAAALYAAEKLPSSENRIKVTPGGAVRYCLPQKIDAAENKSGLDIYFRVGRVVKPATITVKSGDTVLLKKKKQILLPGEMEKITLSSKIDGDITVSAE